MQLPGGDRAGAVQHLQKAAAGQVGAGAGRHAIGHRHPGPAARRGAVPQAQPRLLEVKRVLRVQRQRVLLRGGGVVQVGGGVVGLLEGVKKHISASFVNQPLSQPGVDNMLCNRL